MRKRGIIISFEGIDGCGKTTLAKRFFNYLVKNNYDVVILHEPGGTEIGEKIRKILLDKDKNIDRICELFLYLASRAQLIEEKIKIYVKEGKIVLLDRYIDSTFAYQGYGRGLPLRFIEKIHEFLLGKKFLPDLTFLIDEEPEKLIEILKNKKSDRIEKESIEFQKKIRDGYLKLAQKNKRIKVIKRENKEDTFRKILEIWNEFINEDRKYKKYTSEGKKER